MGTVWWAVRAVGVIGLLASAAVLAQSGGDAEWRYYAGDLGSTRYSPLAQITADNVKNLRPVWRRTAVDPELKQAFPDVSPSNYLRSTPIAVGGVLYAPNALGLLEAFDAASGKLVWKQRPFAPTLGEVAGQSTRGATYWSRGGDERVLLVRGSYLYALNAKTGDPIRAFGENGRTNLRRETPENVPFFSWTGPIVVNDVVVIGGNGGGLSGGGYGDGGFVKEAVPEDIRGYDVRSGRLLWTFKVVPGPGELGNDTWGKDSWKVAGNLGSWSPLSGDEELGHVYVPLSAPPVSYYGGWRPGDNLFSNSLVALDVKTGKRVWHFQMVHHDLWEYDTVGSPTLGDITVDGKRIKAVMQPSKTGYLYAFDRATGAPVWPIEERPVPQSTVPGERTSPTQPFPTKPPPFDRIGLTEDDLIDFTPELRKEALEIVSRFTLGPIFTPPTLRDDAPGGKLGTLIVPGWYGAGNWNTGAFDPETGIYYAVSHTLPNVYDLVPPRPGQRATLDYSVDAGRGANSRHTDIKGPRGLPLTKPPYGRITAIDMNKGEHMWMVPNGDGPRDHPALKGLHLPPLGIAGRPAPLLTKTLLFLGESSDALFGGNQPNSSGRKFRAYDKRTGRVVWETDLPGGTTGAPMTYMAGGVQYIVVPVGAKDSPAEWITFALSGPAVSVTTRLAPTPAWAPKRLLTAGAYAEAQAERGSTAYATSCGGCHGPNLAGGAYGVPLAGDRFVANLRGKPVRELYSRIITTMPPSNPGSLSEAQVLDLVAHILKRNGFPASNTPLTQANDLNDLGLPAEVKR
jgi:glucose dehydrogenase/mono/diheme cytochrome c family protein